MNQRQFFTTQTWWGKIIGAFFGYLMGGPFGALLGVLIGNFFDRGLSEHFSRPHWVYHDEKDKLVQQQVLESTFKVMGHLSKADGQVSTHEIQFAKQLMQELQLNKSQIKEAQAYFNEGKQTAFDLNKLLSQLHPIKSKNLSLIYWFIDIQKKVLFIDGISVKKLQRFNLILNQLGFASYQEQPQAEFWWQTGNAQSHGYHYQSHSQQNNNSYSSSPLENPYTILGISSTASKQEVKRAYRRLLSQHHPDKLIAAKASAERIKEANIKTQQIRKAYEKIMSGF